MLIGTGLMRTARMQVAQRSMQVSSQCRTTQRGEVCGERHGLIELIALQTKQGEWREVARAPARRSLLPSIQLTFKLFALPAHQNSYKHAVPKHIHFVLSLTTDPFNILPLIIPSINRSSPHPLPTTSVSHHPTSSTSTCAPPLSSSALPRSSPPFLARLVCLLTSTIKSSPREHALIPLLVTVTVTKTETNCGAGKCPSVAARQASSNGPTSINALSVLSSAYYSAISAYASAQATDSSLPSFTFVPDLFSSYGLTDVAPTNDPSSPTAAPSSSPDASSNPTDAENSQTSIATSVVPVVPGASSANPPSYSGVPATTPAVTPSPASETPAAGESTANPVESSATVAVPVPSSITDSSAVSSYISSVQSSLSSEVTASYTASPTDSESSAASTTNAPTESSTDQSSSSSTEADAGSATTTEAPVAEQTGNAADINQLPVALGGLAAAAAGLLFI
jgi:hypothetical protein